MEATIVLMFNQDLFFLNSWLILYCSLVLGGSFNKPLLITILALIGKGSILTCFAVMFLFTAELYPTVVRTIGNGACMFIARAGSLSGPQVVYLVS